MISPALPGQRLAGLGSVTLNTTGAVPSALAPLTHESLAGSWPRRSMSPPQRRQGVDPVVVRPRAVRSRTALRLWRVVSDGPIDRVQRSIVVLIRPGHVRVGGHQHVHARSSHVSSMFRHSPRPRRSRRFTGRSGPTQCTAKSGHRQTVRWLRPTHPGSSAGPLTQCPVSPKVERSHRALPAWRTY